jgi:hypothetical protein
VRKEVVKQVITGEMSRNKRDSVMKMYSVAEGEAADGGERTVGRSISCLSDKGQCRSGWREEAN